MWRQIKIIGVWEFTYFLLLLVILENFGTALCAIRFSKRRCLDILVTSCCVEEHASLLQYFNIWDCLGAWEPNQIISKISSSRELFRPNDARAWNGTERNVHPISQKDSFGFFVNLNGSGASLGRFTRLTSGDSAYCRVSSFEKAFFFSNPTPET